MAFAEVEVNKAADYMPVGTAIVTVAVGDKKNALTVTRMACMSSNPMLMVIGVTGGRFSHDMIKEAGEFVINVVAKDQIELAGKVGRVSGRDVAKFAEYNILSRPGSKVKSPVIEGSAAAIECKLVDSITVGDRTMFVGEVVAVSADQDEDAVARLRGKYRELGEQI